MLNFVPDLAAALREMRRVTRPRGVIAAYVWDYADGMQLMRRFWDAAAELDPRVRDLDEGLRFTLCRPEPLHVAHVCVRTNSPKTERETSRTRPAPPQGGRPC